MRKDWEDIFWILVFYLSYAGCCSCFLKRHLQGTYSEAGAFAGILFCCYAGVAVYSQSRGIPYLFYAMLCHVAFVVSAMVIFRGEREKKLLAAVALLVLTELVRNFSESFFSCLRLVLACGIPAHGRTMTEQIRSSRWGERILMVIIHTTSLAVIPFFSKSLEPVFANKRRSFYLCLTVPLVCLILLTDLINWAASNGIVVHDWGRYGLYENQLFSHSAVCLFTGLAMAAAGAFVFGMERADREERMGEEYCSQVWYYQMMEEQYGQMECLRHDMKNHVLVLGNLVGNRQWEKAGSYLREMAETGGVEAADEVTGSLAMDALFYHKRRQAMEWGIRWQCDARLPAGWPVREIDLCVIVGNILDNALESCFRLQERGAKAREESFVRIYVGTVKKCLLLEVKNSTDQEDGWKPGRDKRKTRGERGLGLENIRAAAAVYNGVVHTEVENGVFTTSVLLPQTCSKAGTPYISSKRHSVPWH